jgi:hypothetical protein
LEKCPLLSMGSGKFGIPWERTHRAKASPDGDVADRAASGEAPEPVDDELLAPHAAVSRAAVARTVMTTAVRALRGRAGRGPGDCVFMAASVPPGGGGHITRRK